jgi:hypothetical protein
MQDEVRGGHGSCMLSKIGGNQYGTAKRITPVMMTMDYNKYIIKNFLGGLGLILNDIVQKQDVNQPDAVINTSINWVPAARTMTNAFIQIIRFIIQELIAEEYR